MLHFSVPFNQARGLLSLVLFIVFIIYTLFLKNTDHTCPESWSYFKGHCYNIIKSDDMIRWVDAEYRCENLGAHLVSIRDYEDMEFLHSLLIESLDEGSQPPYSVFIGK